MRSKKASEIMAADGREIRRIRQIHVGFEVVSESHATA